MPNLKAYLEKVAHDERRITELRESVYRSMLSDSSEIKEGNFTCISNGDLSLLFSLYDRHFFRGELTHALTSDGRAIYFRLSRRMTSSAGNIKFSRPIPGVEKHVILSISLPLLGQTFLDIKRPITVNGVSCRDRLEALQRVFEHELVHLVEFLLWGESSCRRERFRDIAFRLFGHSGVSHRLVTQLERAWKKYDVKVGDRVAFEFEGREYRGVVNRITKRATVLVEDPRGTPYTDGKRYAKYYIPLSMLRKADR